MKYKKWILLSLIFMFTSFQVKTFADNVMQINSVSVSTNDTTLIEIEINNDSIFVAFQVDIPLPEELTFVEDSVFYSLRANGNHVLADTILSGDTLRIIGYSTNNTPFSGNAGVIVSFKLISGSDPGNYTLNLINPVIGGLQQNNLLTNSINGIVTILGPDISTSPSLIDFGETPLESYTDRNFSITNNGNQNLIVDSIVIDHSDFEIIGSDNFTLTPSQSQSVSVRFNSQTKGDYEQILTIYNNDPDEQQITVSLEANAFAVNELHTGTFTAFSEDTATLSFSINNMEAFTAFQFDFQLPSVLTYVSNSAVLSRSTNHQVSANMIDNTTLRVVAYSSTNQLFSGSDGVIISLDFYVYGIGGSYSVTLNNPVISGIDGQNAISEYYNSSIQIAAADIHLSSSSINYGDVSVLDSATNSITIYNYGNDTLEINQITSSNSCFTINENLPILILPSGNFPLEIKFVPNNENVFNETLTLKSNDPDENYKILNLQANAYSPNYFSIQDTYAAHGDTVEVYLSAENFKDFTAFQCDIQFPLEIGCLVDSVQLEARAVDHIVSKNLINDTTLRLIAYSASQNNFSGSSEQIAKILFVISDSASFPINIQLSNALMGNDEGEDILYDVNNGSIHFIEQSNIALKVYLEGPFNGTNMNTTLNDNNYIPTLQPYSGSPWNYPGGESVDNIPNNDIVDWVLVELRETEGDSSTATSEKIIWQKAAFLLKNGRVVDTSGVDTLSFQLNVTKNLYAIIYYRNHLGIMSAYSLSKINNYYQYDFTNNVDKVYGGINGHKAIASGIYGMVGGDGDSNGQIQNQDKNDVWNAEFGLSGYRQADYDVNGQVQNQDKNEIWIPNFGAGSQVKKSEQINNCGYKSQIPK